MRGSRGCLRRWVATVGFLAALVGCAAGKMRAARKTAERRGEERGEDARGAEDGGEGRRGREGERRGENGSGKLWMEGEWTVSSRVDWGNFRVFPRNSRRC